MRHRSECRTSFDSGPAIGTAGDESRHREALHMQPRRVMSRELRGGDHPRTNLV